MVVPVFASLFASFGADLPLPTKILMYTSYVLLNYWGYILIISILIIFISKILLLTKKCRILWHRCQLKIPIFSKILKNIFLARFTSMLAMVTETGLPISKALYLVANASSNIYLRYKLVIM